MIDLITAKAGLSSGIIQRACQYVMDKSPDGPLAQYYYVTAKLYRCVSKAVGSLPPFGEASLEEKPASTCERVSIAMIKREVEEMVKLTRKEKNIYHSSREQSESDVESTVATWSNDFFTDNGEMSFDFVDNVEFQSICNGDEEFMFSPHGSGMQPGMEEFMELLMSCAKESEI
ncbi:hypothetical protein BgAZ_205300 [Babesia gibsoni]|uniref:Uncharacterized protein n=1 Tax=Babesia gibsoni TaxID=33632 RepID=A0AAD8LK04_BABGI|nr:hypothetical protein BgAZ_205300 [Babesia gibsoni]